MPDLAQSSEDLENLLKDSSKNKQEDKKAEDDEEHPLMKFMREAFDAKLKAMGTSQSSGDPMDALKNSDTDTSSMQMSRDESSLNAMDVESKKSSKGVGQEAELGNVAELGEGAQAAALLI